ncbi:prepilin peptidase-dependent protein [Providencia vermicola]|uniref:prepilin peptidase-dependent protein n=1 Tax=Providencia vermicola TaxID=333965 RepID=UPI001CEDCE7D|nr:prepilin peptidase-dependent protein [Providencia vermicola]
MLTLANCLNKARQKGFTLIEMLVAMVISSLICLAVMNSIPSIFKQTYRAYFQYQINRDVRQVLLNMEKDFRRIGYCHNSSCQGEPIMISAKSLSEGKNTCIIFAYDQDLSGEWVDVKSKKRETDYFGYRLNNGKLESNRNVRDCSGTRWQSLFDAKLVTVKKLAFNWIEDTQLLEVIMSVETRLLAGQLFEYRISVKLRNL